LIRRLQNAYIFLQALCFSSPHVGKVVYRFSDSVIVSSYGRAFSLLPTAEVTMINDNLMRMALAIDKENVGWNWIPEDKLMAYACPVYIGKEWEDGMLCLSLDMTTICEALFSYLGPEQEFVLVDEANNVILSSMSASAGMAEWIFRQEQGSFASYEGTEYQLAYGTSERLSCRIAVLQRTVEYGHRVRNTIAVLV